MSLYPRKYGDFTNIQTQGLTIVNPDNTVATDGYVATMSSGSVYMKPVTYGLEMVPYAPVTTVFNSMWDSAVIGPITVNTTDTLLGQFTIPLTSTNWFYQTVGRPIQISYTMPYSINTPNVQFNITTTYQKNSESEKTLLGGEWQGPTIGTVSVSGRTQTAGNDTTFIVGDTLSVNVNGRINSGSHDLTVLTDYPVGTISPVA
jgi:hypothetical protein